MRTPRGSKQRGGAKETKRETNKLRKKAMKNKMMKKTMLTLAGDDTKEEFRDLINESNLSNISIIGRSPAPPPPRNQKKKNGKKSPAATEKRTPAARKSLRSLRSQVSIKSLSSKLSRNNSNKEMNGLDMSMDTSESAPGKAKLVKLEPTAAAAGPTENGHTEETATGSRLQGMKNLISSAVWGVPYAQVVEESEPLNSTQDNNSRCIIS